jgi:hypothetical protein
VRWRCKQPIAPQLHAPSLARPHASNQSRPKISYANGGRVALKQVKRELNVLYSTSLRKMGTPWCGNCTVRLTCHGTVSCSERVWPGRMRQSIEHVTCAGRTESSARRPSPPPAPCAPVCNLEPGGSALAWVWPAGRRRRTPTPCLQPPDGRTGTHGQDKRRTNYGRSELSAESRKWYVGGMQAYVI